MACADAGATLISPFVGRILDWYVAHEGRHFSAAEDPGVHAVTRIYNYYTAHGVRTTVMAASFRSADEARQLAGCDAITLSPPILDALGRSTEPLARAVAGARARGVPRGRGARAAHEGGI